MSRPLTRPLVQPVPDRRGLLYDPTLRAMISEIGSATPLDAIEALAAVRQASKRLHDEFESWTSRHGLSESGFRVLAALYYSQDRNLTLGALAQRLEVVPRTITDVTDVLEREGMVRRLRDPNDRRSVRAELTKAGTQRMSNILRTGLTRQAALTKGLSSKELTQLRHLCLLLVRNMNDQYGDA